MTDPKLIRAQADLDRAWATHRDMLPTLETIFQSGYIGSDDVDQKCALAAVALVIAELKFRYASDDDLPVPDEP